LAEASSVDLLKLLLNEHFSPVIAAQLRERGHDVVAAEEVGLGQRHDEEVFKWATDHGRAVVTRNVQDYRPIRARQLSRGEAHFGLILVPRRFSLSRAGFGQLTQALDELLERLEDDRTLASAEYWL